MQHKIKNGISHDKKTVGKDCSLNLMKKRPPRLREPEAMSVFLAVGLNKEDIMTLRLKTDINHIRRW